MIITKREHVHPRPGPCPSKSISFHEYLVVAGIESNSQRIYYVTSTMSYSEKIAYL